MSASEASCTVAAAPFPLLRSFYRFVLPIMALLSVVSVGLSLYSGGRLIEDVYLTVAQRRADALAHIMARQAPVEWQVLLSLKPRDAVPNFGQASPLARSVQQILHDSHLNHLKLYDRQGRLLFSTEDEEVGTFTPSVALLRVLEKHQPQISLPDDNVGRLYELYAWLADSQGEPALVIELYEPAEFLDGLLLSNVGPAVAIPLLMTGGLTLYLARLVRRAQADIDSRALALSGVTERLERLVSAQALGAARHGGANGIQSRLIDATLFYSDIRSFTSYAEEHPPEMVVELLNRLMTIQIRCIHAHHGDVDKLIGDAILAVFEGSDRAARAIACAKAIQNELAAMTDLPRPLGIGVFDGHVIAGTIGPEERQDFTVIGDSVNVSARLCSAAHAGEVVSEARTLARAGHPEGFSTPEDLVVKGRSEPLRVCRFRPLASSVLA